MPTLEDFAPHRLERVRLRRKLREKRREFLAHRASHADPYAPPCVDCLVLWRQMIVLVKALGGGRKRR